MKKFFEFKQNNSGGYFDVDENVCNRVVVEANSLEEAIAIMEPMVENQSGSCPCCGDRWSLHYADEVELTKYKKEGYAVGIYDHYKNAEEKWMEAYGMFTILKQPEWIKHSWGTREYIGRVSFKNIEDYCQFMANKHGWTTPDCRIYYKNGKVKEIFKFESE